MPVGRAGMCDLILGPKELSENGQHRGPCEPPVHVYWDASESGESRKSGRRTGQRQQGAKRPVRANPEDGDLARRSNANVPVLTVLRERDVGRIAAGHGSDTLCIEQGSRAVPARWRIPRCSRCRRW